MDDRAALAVRAGRGVAVGRGGYASSVTDEGSDGPTMFDSPTVARTRLVPPRLRAETVDRPVLVARRLGSPARFGVVTGPAGSGKSTFITTDGQTGETTEQLEERVLYGSLQFNADVPTLWVRFGDWLAFLAMAAGLAAVVVSRSSERDKTSIAGRGGQDGFAPSG